MGENNIIRIILEALDRNTGPVIQGATTNVTKLGTATKLTAEQEKKLAGEFDGLLKRIDPAYAAQARFTAGTAILEKGLKANVISQQQAARGWHMLKAELDEAAKAANNADGEFTALGRTLGGAAIATAVLGIGKASLDAAQEADQAAGRIEAVINATGYAAGLTKEELDGMADSLSKVTRFDDEQLRNGIAVMLSFKQISGDGFGRALKLSADLAELMQTDFKSAVLQLGKALEEPETGITALTRAGITFSAAQKDVIKSMVETGDRAGAMNMILDELERQVGGTAEKIDRKLTKSTSEAGKAWDELMESIGKTETVEDTTSAVLGSWTKYLSDMKRVVESGDWLDRLAFFSVGLTTPSMLEENQFTGSVGGEEARLAREGKLQQELNTLLETRAELEKKINAERSKATTKNITEQRDGIKEQIQGYKTLRQAMLQAFDDAGRAAQDATEKAQGFLDRASSTRQSAKDRILNRKINSIASPDTTGLSEEDAAFVKARALDEADAKRASAVSDALYQASVLRAKAIEELSKGNIEGSQRLLDLSDDQISRASDFADQLDDEERARSAIEEVAGRSAENDEKRAEIERQRAADETKRREELGKKINENDASLATLEASLTEIEEKLKALSEEKATVAFEADQASFNDVNAKIDELLRKKAELAKPVAVQASANQAADEGGATGNFAGGGPIFGSGPKGIDSVLIKAAPGEHMWPDDEVDAVGGHAWMYRLRAMARAGHLKRLLTGGVQRFDIGGEVGASRAARSVISRIAMPVLPSTDAITGSRSGSGMHRGTFPLGNGQSVELHGTPNAFDALISHSLQVRRRRA